MKKIKTTGLDPAKMITKSEYARKVGISPPAVQKQIDTGKLVIVKITGAEIIHE